MKFEKNIFELDKPHTVKFNLVGAKLPNTNDLYFRSKQHELVEQYSAARIFLNETETDDWNHWFNRKRLISGWIPSIHCFSYNDW